MSCKKRLDEAKDKWWWPLVEEYGVTDDLIELATKIDQGARSRALTEAFNQPPEEPCER